MFIGPRHFSGAQDSRAPLGRLATSNEWRAPMSGFFQGVGVPGFVDSWPKTLVSSASNRSTPSGLLWTPGNCALVEESERPDLDALARLGVRGRGRVGEGRMQREAGAVPGRVVA